MSLFGDIASAIGHTVDSLAAAVGTDISVLETVVSDLAGNGIDVFSAATRLGLSVEGFLSGIVTLMRSDPHQLLLERLTAPVKPLDNALSQLSHQWAQVANLHQETAQAVDSHMNSLYQGSASYSYSGPAADTLWETHQDYRNHFNTLVEHAQTQQVRHATLQSHTSEYLSQMPRTVSSLSTPMAALGVLSLNSASAVESSPGEVISPQFIQQVEDIARNAWNNSEDVPPGPEDPIWDFLELCVLVLTLFAGILMLINWLADGISQFINAQKSTPPPQKKPKVGPSKPTPTPLPPQQEIDLETLVREFPYVSADDIKGLLLAGFTPDEIRAILQARFTHAQIQAIISRINAAQKDQHGTDKLGLTAAQIRDMVNRIAIAVNSPDKEKQWEGEVAQSVIADVVSFQRKIYDPATGMVVGEIDVETSTAIIEVTTAPGDKLGQLVKDQSNPDINPKDKNVVLYAPNYSHSADLQFAEHDIPIIRTLKELFDELRLLGGG